MCEYCNNKYDNLVLWYDEYSRCRINKFGIVCINGEYDFDGVRKKEFTFVKYCPMCGKRLVPDNLYVVYACDDDGDTECFFFDSLKDSKDFIINDVDKDCECIDYEIDYKYAFRDSCGIMSSYKIVKIL